MTAHDLEFLLPDVGEGLTEAEIIRWFVAPGDAVEVNQIVVEIETAKSVVELPSPFSGIVSVLAAAEGETVEVGEPIFRVTAAESHESDCVEFPEVSASAEEVEPKLLVGYGANETSTRRAGGHRIRRRSEAAARTLPPVNRHVGLATNAEAATRPRTKPSVRALAISLGVDLSEVTGSGLGGVILRADILARAATIDPDGQKVPAGAPTGMSVSTPAAPRPDQRLPITGVRKQTAAAVVRSAFTAPHVTEFVTVDMTKSLRLRDSLQVTSDNPASRMSPLVFVAHAYMWALRRTPIGNGRWDEDAQEIVVPPSVNLGVAVATTRGLVVPNIKNADSLRLTDLSNAISDLATRTRAGKVSLSEMRDGTATITNIGVFGVDGGTPILNPGESSVLAVGTMRRAPWVVGKRGKEKVSIRSVLQLALSFDHRVMDGQEGSQILADTARAVQDPAVMLA